MDVVTKLRCKMCGTVFKDDPYATAYEQMLIHLKDSYKGCLFGLVIDGLREIHELASLVDGPLSEKIMDKADDMSNKYKNQFEDITER